jgi:hypothetical protein
MIPASGCVRARASRGPACRSLRAQPPSVDRAFHQKERRGWLHRAHVGLTALGLDMQWLGRTRLTLVVDHTVVRAQLSVPAGGICSGRVCCRLLPNISTTGGSLDIASRVVSAGECARPVVIATFVHGELCLGESSRLVSALPLFSAPVPVLPAHPLHFPPRRSRFAHAALSSSSRPSSLRAYIDRPRPPCLPLVPRRRRPPALLHGGVLP